jgi:hypothetical protein
MKVTKFEVEKVSLWQRVKAFFTQQEIDSKVVEFKAEKGLELHNLVAFDNGAKAAIIKVNGDSYKAKLIRDYVIKKPATSCRVLIKVWLWNNC